MTLPCRTRSCKDSKLLSRSLLIWQHRFVQLGDWTCLKVCHYMHHNLSQLCYEVKQTCYDLDVNCWHVFWLNLNLSLGIKSLTNLVFEISHLRLVLSDDLLLFCFAWSQFQSLFIILPRKNSRHNRIKTCNFVVYFKSNLFKSIMAFSKKNKVSLLHHFFL